MTVATFVKESILPYAAATVFDWHARPGAFERLNAPWKPVKVLQSSGGIENGSEVVIKVPILGSCGVTWKFRHRDYVPGKQFTDEQIAGPFKKWRHIHSVIPAGDAQCTLRDEITYELPTVATPLGFLFVRELRRLFQYRHSVLAHDLALHARWASRPRASILVSGSSGLVGSALTSFLTTAGHSVIRLVRRQPTSPLERAWNPLGGELDPSVFEGIDVVIHLGGDDIASGRWTAAKKARIRDSRVASTSLLCSTIAKLPRPPRVTIMASAIGYYGDTGATEVDENGPLGHGFLPDTCREWEAASSPLRESDTRLVTMRIGTVLTSRGGALKKMLPAFLAGVGGPLGQGSQFMSWISLQDLLGIFEHAIHSDTLDGTVNAVSPNPTTNYDFVKALSSVLRRPTVLPLPGFALRILFGELADAALLASTRVVPTALRNDGYSFLQSDLKEVLRFECGR
jgi:uncharacterized protein (TIGR01777 family)